MNWPKHKWAIYLGTQLKGKAMEIYGKIPEDKLQDFEEVVKIIDEHTLDYKIVSKTKQNNLQKRY